MSFPVGFSGIYNSSIAQHSKIANYLQLAIHMVQNHYAGEQKSQWDKTNKRNYRLKLHIPFVGLVPVPLKFALQLGCFVPLEWLKLQRAQGNSCAAFLINPFCY